MGKKIGRINGVAVLPGQAQISWLEGSNNKYTVHRIHRIVHISKQLECRYRVPAVIEKATQNFPSVYETLFKFGHKSPQVLFKGTVV